MARNRACFLVNFDNFLIKIAKINESRDENSEKTAITGILVNFIGDNSQYLKLFLRFLKNFRSAQLSLDKVAKFQDNFELYSRVKHRKLAESVEIAQKILSGATTYESERDRLAEVFYDFRDFVNVSPRTAEKPRKSKNMRKKSQILVLLLIFY